MPPSPVLPACLSFLLAAGPAWGLVLCKTKQGQLLVRDTCKRKETTLALSDIGGTPGPQGAQGPAGPEGPRGRRGPGLSVRDADNTLVGGVAGTLARGSVLLVAREIRTETVRLPLTADGFVEVDPAAAPVMFAESPRGPLVFSYASSDCRGDAFIAYDADFALSTAGPLLRDGLVRGTTAYFPTGAVTLRSLQSQRVVTTDEALCTGAAGAWTAPDACCLQRAPFDAPAGAVGTLDLAGLNFMSPFHADVL